MKIGDKVRDPENRTGRVFTILGDYVSVQLDDSTWPFPVLTNYRKQQLVVVDPLADVKEALL